jgi:hypothetical protein
MALSNLSLFGGAFFTPVIVGKMTRSLGWPWPFYFVAIFSGVILPLVFFFVPETAYRRSAYLNTDISSTDDFHVRRRLEEAHELGDAPSGGNTTNSLPGGENTPREGSFKGPQEDTEQKRLTKDTEAFPATDSFGKNSPEKPSRAQHANPIPPKKVSFAKSLLPFNGRKTDESFFKLLFRPFPLFFHPAILWVSSLCTPSSIGCRANI